MAPIRWPAAAGIAINGRVAEWFKAAVLKTAVRATAPWVRIPPLPPDAHLLESFFFGCAEKKPRIDPRFGRHTKRPVTDMSTKVPGKRRRPKGTATQAQPPPWMIVRLTGTPAWQIGMVEAPDAEVAIAEAIRQFDIPPEQAKRLAARRVT